ncbi:hypothetical protein [uncultured Desulfuromusa sp.]|uniref:hypothetical protein n=1 Tax=uncultured Desulfuromusa sp. TaxID=219183 RepID=UPI002AA90FE6|nr:hypothetical protein [uncultured Desulfuromusa sp.]
MAEQMDKSQLLQVEVAKLSNKIRNLLCKQDPEPSKLADSLHAIIAFKNAILVIDAESFRSIAERMEIVLSRHSVAGTVPTKLEIETIELAADWLDQLALLHKENLPEPRSLVAELLYTFDLVECSNDAISLAELVSSHAGDDVNKCVDPFFEDPEVSVEDRAGSPLRDPFAEDPGFGLEFDLLQRTVHFVAETNTIDEDPFSADPSIDSEEDAKSNSEKTSALTESPYDIFAGDPPLTD